MPRYILTGALVAIVVLACGTDGSETPAAPEEGTTLPTPDEPILTTLPSKPTPTQSSPVVVAEDPSDSVAAAERSSRALLVVMRDVSNDSIETLMAEQVTWNDGSLGCPEPGGYYTQSLVPGFRVVLSVDDVDYAFHGAEGGRMKYCANPSSGFNPNN